jgi:hypothetical protein
MFAMPPKGRTMRATLRSRELIDDADLARLASLARDDLAALFRRNDDLRRLYAKRLVCIALCQGAALHYIDRGNGVKDFDLWAFCAEHRERPFPYRRHAREDFGPSKFGRHPDDRDPFQGRRVDMMARSLPVKRGVDPVHAVRAYLTAGRTETARKLAAKAAVIVWPEALRGTVAWPPPGGESGD